MVSRDRHNRSSISASRRTKVCQWVSPYMPKVRSRPWTLRGQHRPVVSTSTYYGHGTISPDMMTVFTRPNSLRIGSNSTFRYHGTSILSPRPIGVPILTTGPWIVGCGTTLDAVPEGSSSRPSITPLQNSWASRVDWFGDYSML